VVPSFLLQLGFLRLSDQPNALISATAQCN
jgi:hypothetical protein